MKKIFNKNLILDLIICLSFSIVSVYAATTYLASDVKYKDTTVENALDELYNKKNDSITVGYPSVNSDANGGMSSVYNRDNQGYTGYGPNMIGWYTANYVNNAWNAFNYSEKVNVKYARIAYGVTPDTTWMREGKVTIQASNDNFNNEIVDLATVELKFDQELLKEKKYGVFWEGNINNENYYYSYRVIAKDSSGFTGVNKLQLTYIRYYGTKLANKK